MALALHIGGSRDRDRICDLGEETPVLPSDTNRSAMQSQVVLHCLKLRSEISLEPAKTIACV